MRSARFPLDLPVRYRCVGEGAWRHGVTENISRSGILIRTENCLAIQANVELQVELPNQAAGAAPPAIWCRGHAVRSISPSDDRPWSATAVAIEDYDFLPDASLAGQ